MINVVKILFLGLLLSACAKEPSNIEKNPIPLKEDNWKGYYHYLVGEHFASQNHYEESVFHFNEAMQSNQAKEIQYRMVIEHAQNYNFEQALEMIDVIFQKYPQDFQALLLRAKIFATQGLYQESISDFLTLDSHPDLDKFIDDKKRIDFSLIILEIEIKKYDDARKRLLALLNQDAQDELANYYLARIYAEKGQFKEAKLYYQKTIQANPNFFLAYKALILMHEYFKETDQKIKVMEEMLKLQPNDIAVRTQLIQHYTENQDSKGVQHHENYFINRFEHHVGFCLELGLFYIEKKQFESARGIFETCQKRYPENDTVEYYLAISNFYLNQKEKAIVGLERIPPESEFFDKSILARASILRDQYSHPEIVQIFEMGIKQKPTSSDIPLHYARYQMENKNDGQAKAILNKAIKRFDQNESIAIVLAEVLEKEKSYDDMEKVLRNVLDKNPASASALNFLGYSYADRNIKLDEAEKMILKALEIQPKDGYIQDSLAWVYYRQGKFDQALKMIEIALSHVQTESVIWEHYGEVLLKLNKKDKAIEAFLKAYQLEQDENKKKELLQTIDRLSKL